MKKQELDTLTWQWFCQLNPILCFIHTNNSGSTILFCQMRIYAIAAFQVGYTQVFESTKMIFDCRCYCVFLHEGSKRFLFLYAISLCSFSWILIFAEVDILSNICAMQGMIVDILRRDVLIKSYTMIYILNGVILPLHYYSVVWCVQF